MPGFSDSLWTPDSPSGLGVLYGKLQQRVVRNKQILAIASMPVQKQRISMDSAMEDIAPSVDRMTAVGFGLDDCTLGLVRKVCFQTRGMDWSEERVTSRRISLQAYEGIRTEMIGASKNHQKIANNILELVISPFRRWSEQHDMRVQYSHDLLQSDQGAHQARRSW
ncbi:hypothetical protein N7447_008013 [Penicillium robsamsonii]|uniref:uncharacterized protein n=1 Tax=Penicillium robsamsonii TaxID=1792511 RepID=UPI002547EA3D|nr:uncharacterized protein N7447_008013 [Penicillium robsamsonii]KAJ5818005.1 hypothetical protein N7447_008013 [Penicillium robsamsonii]